MGYNQFSNQTTGLTNQEALTNDYFGNPLSDIFSISNSNNRSKVKSIDYSLDYKKKFAKEGQELEIAYNASNGTPYSNYSQSQSYIGESIPFSGSSTTNPGTDNEMSLSADYSQPVTKDFLIETGAKMSTENITSIANVNDFDPDLNQFVSDQLQSYSLTYKMKIYAGYLSSNFKLFNWLNVKAGARYEYTEININSQSNLIPPMVPLCLHCFYSRFQ